MTKTHTTLTVHIVHTRTDYGNFFNLVKRSMSWNNLPFSLHLFKRLKKLYFKSLPYNVHEDVHDRPVIIDET